MIIRRLFLFLFFVSIINLSQAQNKIIAVVNDEAITEKELRDYLNMVKLKLSEEYQGQYPEEEFIKEKESALDRLIEDRLIIQEAKKKQIEIPEALIDRKVDEFASRFVNKQDFENSLLQQGLTISSLKKKAKEQFLMRQIINDEIRSKIQVLPYEVTDYYNLHKEEFKSKLSVDYRALKFSQHVQAYLALEELKKSQDFESTIAKYSQNLAQGTITKDQSRKELGSIFELKEKEISAPILIGEEYYLFIIDKINPEKVLSIDEIKDKIWQNIYQEKFEKEIFEWFNTLKEKAVIKILDSSLSGS